LNPSEKISHDGSMFSTAIFPLVRSKNEVESSISIPDRRSCISAWIGSLPRFSSSASTIRSTLRSQNSGRDSKSVRTRTPIATTVPTRLGSSSAKPATT
jgi:hypothetical protein